MLVEIPVPAQDSSPEQILDFANTLSLQLTEIRTPSLGRLQQQSFDSIPKTYSTALSISHSAKTLFATLCMEFSSYLGDFLRHPSQRQSKRWDWILYQAFTVRHYSNVDMEELVISQPQTPMHPVPLENPNKLHAVNTTYGIYTCICQSTHVLLYWIYGAKQKGKETKHFPKDTSLPTLYYLS